MKHLIAVIIIVFPIFLFGQTKQRDEIGLAPNAMDSIKLEVGGMSGIQKDTCSFSNSYKQATSPLPLYGEVQSSVLYAPGLSIRPGLSMPLSWHSGEIIATGGVMEMPGLMRVNSGYLGIFQRAGNFSFYIGGAANKYGYFQGVHTQYGLNGSVSYRLSSGVSFTAFGVYYFGNPPTMNYGLPMSPSMIGYYGVSKFGGYLDYQVNERFGIEMGGQHVQQVGTGRYEFEPIATPYVNIGNGKTKVHIGLPVGQIIYGIFKR